MFGEQRRKFWQKLPRFDTGEWRAKIYCPLYLGPAITFCQCDHKYYKLRFDFHGRLWYTWPFSPPLQRTWHLFGSIKVGSIWSPGLVSAHFQILFAVPSLFSSTKYWFLQLENQSWWTLMSNLGLHYYVQRYSSTLAISTGTFLKFVPEPIDAGSEAAIC